VSKDLLSDRARWQGRVSEIFRHVDGPADNTLVTYACRAVDKSLTPPANWVDVLNEGFHRILVRRVGREVGRIVLRRALGQAAAARPEVVAVPEAPAFPPDWPALARRPGAAFLLAAALADRLECLIGTEEAAGFRAALGPLLVGPEDTRSP
jgi:hypothetical protein